MRDKIEKSALICLFFLAAFCLYPAMTRAVVAIQTEVVSGNIVQQYENNAVKLDNGEIYQPSRKGLVINLQVGEAVTLRYYVENSKTNVFFEFASGLNSLNEQDPASVKKDNSPK